MHDPNLREVVDRVRRIETRVTKIGEHFDIDVGGGKPMWRDGKVIVPSPNCSVGAILKIIPESVGAQDVDVYIKGDYLFTLFVDP